MKAIQHHIYAVTATFGTLFKGKLLLFFLPGFVAGGLYYMFYLATEETGDSISSTVENVWFIGDYLKSGVDAGFDFFQFVLFEFFKFFIITLLSPFNSVLSEKFDTELTGRRFESGFVQIMNDLLRAALIALIAFTLEMVFLLGWWFLSTFLLGFFLPDAVDTVIYFLMSSFFFGFAFYDFSLERYSIGTFRSIGFAFEKMLYMVLTGSVFTLIMTVPAVGFIIAPALTTMISTAAYIKMNNIPSTPPELL